MPDGHDLAALRRLANLTQGDVATRIGTSKPNVTQVESRDYVRSDTASKFQKAILVAVEERAISGLLAETMRSLIKTAD